MINFSSSLTTVIFLAIVFDFLPSRFVTLSAHELPIFLHTKLSDTSYAHNLKIRPISTNALVVIFDQAKDTWISQYALWTELPTYTSSLKVKPIFTGHRFDLAFEVLDTSTGSVYKTPARKIWSPYAPKVTIKSLVTSLHSE